MLTDSILLAAYLAAYIVAVKGHSTTPLITALWALAFVAAASSFITAGIHPAACFFMYWVFALTLCVISAVRGAAVVLWAASAMALLQLGLFVDVLIGSRDSWLIRSYSDLATVAHALIICAAFLHGRGVESVGRSNSNSSRVNGKGS